MHVRAGHALPVMGGAGDGDEHHLRVGGGIGSVAVRRWCGRVAGLGVGRRISGQRFAPRGAGVAASSQSPAQPGTSGPASVVRMLEATVITKTLPSRAVCWAAANHWGIESQVGASRISMPSRGGRAWRGDESSAGDLVEELRGGDEQQPGEDEVLEPVEEAGPAVEREGPVRRNPQRLHIAPTCGSTPVPAPLIGGWLASASWTERTQGSSGGGSGRTVQRRR